MIAAGLLLLGGALLALELAGARRRHAADARDAARAGHPCRPGQPVHVHRIPNPERDDADR